MVFLPRFSSSSTRQPCADQLVQAWYAQLYDACATMGLNFGVYCTLLTNTLRAPHHLVPSSSILRSVAVPMERNLREFVLLPWLSCPAMVCALRCKTRRLSCAQSHRPATFDRCSLRAHPPSTTSVRRRDLLASMCFARATNDALQPRSAVGPLPS
jgi:hypothetical protein